MRRFIILALLFPLSTAAHDFSAVTATAVAALHTVADADICAERAGVIILEPSGHYRATVPQLGSETHFRLVVRLRYGERIAGIYHTHPLCGETKTDVYFSPNDVHIANLLHVPSFIWVAYDNSIRVYVPGSDSLIYSPKLHDSISLGAVLGHYSCTFVGVRLNMDGTVRHKQVCTGE